MVFVGGLALYMNQREEAAAIREFQALEAQGVYRLEITASFDAESDPFALDIDDTTNPSALLVRLRGEEILRREEGVKAGSPIVVSPVEGLTVGRNEFYMEASPPLDLAERSHAVRVRIFRDETALLDRTLWTEPGVRLATAFEIDIRPESAGEEKTDGER
jgi:hypothetical protein